MGKCHPSNKLPEFAFLREINPTFDFNLSVVDLDGNVVATFDESALGTNLVINTYSNGTELVEMLNVFDSFGSDEYLENGCYYLVMTDGTGDTYYSEVFCYPGFVTGDMSCYSVLRITSSCEVTGSGNVYYPNFLQHIYIQNDIGLPEYPYTEETAQNTDRSQTILWRAVEKIRQMYFYGPEYIADFFSLIGMMDEVIYYTESETYTFESCASEIVWEETSDCEARINLSLKISYVSKNNCCDPLLELNLEAPESICNVVAKIDCIEGVFDVSSYNTGDLILGCCDGNCFVYKVVAGKAILQSQLNIQGSVVFDEATGDYWYYSSGGYNVPYLYLYFDPTSGLTGVMRGHAPTGFTCTLQIDTGSGFADTTAVVSSATFSTTGFPSDTYIAADYRVKVSNHSQIAYTNEITLV